MQRITCSASSLSVWLCSSLQVDILRSLSWVADVSYPIIYQRSPSVFTSRISIIASRNGSSPLKPQISLINHLRYSQSRNEGRSESITFCFISTESITFCFISTETTTDTRNTITLLDRASLQLQNDILPLSHTIGSSPCRWGFEYALGSQAPLPYLGYSIKVHLMAFLSFTNSLCNYIVSSILI